MKELKEAIRKLSQNEDEVYSIVGEVKDVDTAKRTCTVSPLSGDADILGVRLQSTLSNNKGVVVVPKVGSKVIVTFLNSVTGYLALCSDIEKADITFGQLTIQVQDTGVHIERNGGDLRKIMDKMIENTEMVFDLLIQLKVVTPSGIGTLSPDMITKVAAEKAKLTILKNQLSQLLI